MTSTIRAAIIQAPPIPLNIDAGTEEAVRQIEMAANQGAQVVGFGETWLGGYPAWLDDTPGAALWDHPGTKALHRILLNQGIQRGDTRLKALQAATDRTGAVVSIGAHERVRSSLYNAQFTFVPGASEPVVHRKLVPTHGERLIWARGDGSTLGLAHTDIGRIGGLICWEHWMPLARATMHNQQEMIHIAQWPTVRETYLLASRHYAFEGRCFVLACGLIQTRQDYLDGLASLDKVEPEALDILSSLPDGQLISGGSAFIGPDAAILAGPLGTQSAILTADLDLAQIEEALCALDTDGHYSRPDVFDLTVNTRPQGGVRFTYNE